MANNTDKKKFLPAEVGKDAKGKPHAFHVEGHISKPAYFKEGSGDKKSYLGTSMGIGMSPERMMALAEGTYDKTKDYGEANGFVSLNLFGEDAEKFSKVCVTGLHVAVAGTLEWHEYPLKSGNGKGKELRILVDKLVVMGSKSVEAVVTDTVGVATRVYTGSDGVQRSTAIVELMNGTVIGTRELAYSDKQKAYLSFGVKTEMPAEKIYDLAAGTYDSKKEYDTKKRIVNVVVFDKAAEALSKVVRDGAQVVCSGPVELREYNENITYQMKARPCSIMKFAPKSEDGAAPAEAPNGTAAAAAADTSEFVPLSDVDDDELPF